MNTDLIPSALRGEKNVSRRSFIKVSATTGLALATGGAASLLHAEEEKKPASETLVKTLYDTLTEKQKKAIVFPYDNALRREVDNNWHITKQKIGKFFTDDQQEMIKQIFLGIHSPEYQEAVYKQVAGDSGKVGFGACSIAVFGEPGSEKSEFVLTGRHCTRRCDGNSEKGVAFGGPIFYGHAAQSFNEKPDHPGNAYWYQARRANEVFQMLDGTQWEKALLNERGREEEGADTVALTGKTEGLPGIPLADLAQDQKDHVEKVLSDLLAMFRKEDADEAMKLVRNSGMDNLHMAFYKKQDIGKDGVWDVWQIEGPSMVWYFRGSPHVHAWVNIRDKA